MIDEINITNATTAVKIRIFLFLFAILFAFLTFFATNILIIIKY